MVQESVTEKKNPSQAPQIRLRLRFRKTGRLRYISHLDLVRTMTKAVLRAKLPVWYTMGFNPVPKMVFATPMSVGMESLDELVEIRMTEKVDPRWAIEALNAAVPRELRFYEAYEPENKLTDVAYAEYEVLLSTELPLPETAESIRALLADPTLKCTNLTHGKQKERTVGTQTGDAEVSLTDDGRIRMLLTLGVSQGEFLNPEYVVAALAEHLPILAGSPLHNFVLTRRLRVLNANRERFV
ncbi:MAG: TIGR03936 family radical SAM-associated protein [Clostridia bacterium]|nr:TIGR03936 family radical SAM-associated protein [Clostridia bacterium]